MNIKKQTKKRRAVCTLSDELKKLNDKFIYLGINITFIERDVNKTHREDIDRLLIIWKSDISG